MTRRNGRMAAVIVGATAAALLSAAPGRAQEGVPAGGPDQAARGSTATTPNGGRAEVSH